jgi:hypothetical protein
MRQLPLVRVTCAPPLKAMIVANTYLESELTELQVSESKGYPRGQWQAMPRSPRIGTTDWS